MPPEKEGTQSQEVRYYYSAQICPFELPRERQETFPVLYDHYSYRNQYTQRESQQKRSLTILTAYPPHVQDPQP